MRKRPPSPQELRKLQGIIAFQFSERVSKLLIPDDARIFIEETVKGGIRGIYVNDIRVGTLRPNDGLLSLSICGAKIVLQAEEPPKFRVIVKGDRELTGSVLVRDVENMDDNLRPGDEAIIVDSKDQIIGVGRVRLSKFMLIGLDRGEVVRIRKKVRNKEIECR